MTNEIVLADFSNNSVIPVSIDWSDVPVDNPKVTRREVSLYTGLQIKEYRSGLWLVANKKSIWEDNFTAPIGSIVRISYRTGSWKHAYITFTVYFRVEDIGDKEYRIENDTSSEYGKREYPEILIKVRNLRLLEKVSREKKSEAEAEIYNTYNARCSDYAPVRTLYIYWLKEPIATDIETQIQVLEREIKELQRILKEKRKQLKKLKTQLSKAKAVAQNL